MTLSGTMLQSSSFLVSSNLSEDELSVAVSTKCHQSNSLLAFEDQLLMERRETDPIVNYELQIENLYRHQVSLSSVHSTARLSISLFVSMLEYHVLCTEKVETYSSVNVDVFDGHLLKQRDCISESQPIRRLRDTPRSSHTK